MGASPTVVELGAYGILCGQSYAPFVFLNKSCLDLIIRVMLNAVCSELR
ncbi:Hypothetical protein Cp262_2123 [Corynebacterium pseudotuberculosis]|nr:Hypothetical protein Cp262_2123 [Corynebacterium pseudotuberculosis]